MSSARAIRLIVGAFLLCAGTPAAAQVDALRPHAAEWEALTAAEDARAASASQMDVLKRGLASPAPVMRALAARAVGRLERADLLPLLIPLLRDPAPDVRAAAAAASAQAVHGSSAPVELRAALIDAAADPATADASTAAAAAEALGRIASPDIDAARHAAGVIVRHLDGDAEARLGALRGLYFLVRQQGMRTALDSAAIMRVRALAARRDGSDRVSERTRAIAMMLLAATGGADTATVRSALADPDRSVRREAVVATASLNDTAAVRPLLQRALADPAAMVRYDAVRMYARRFAAAGGCTAAARAADDSADIVAIAALDLLGTSCAGDPAARGVLLQHATATDSARWQRTLHALVALATVDSAAARPLISRHAASQNFFTRTWAAGVYAVLRDTAALRALAVDPHANVRTAAVTALHRITGPAYNDVYRAALNTDESELLMAATAALEGSTDPAVRSAALRTLARLSSARRETWRDGRVALLELLAEMPGPGTGGELPLGELSLIRQLVTDLDPEVANRAAALNFAWTREHVAPQPAAAPAFALPSFAEAARLDAARVEIVLASGDTVLMKLLPFAAPANATRFARLAQAGYFDGLTFHRVVPNFVLQGGSPGANEYSGDGAFSRDEVEHPNWLGTVGLSTRGRDTGDAQFYVNLVHNVRLDHEYTVFAVVTAGMPALETLQEGAAIRTIRIQDPSSQSGGTQ